MLLCQVRVTKQLVQQSLLGFSGDSVGCVELLRSQVMMVMMKLMNDDDDTNIDDNDDDASLPGCSTRWAAPW